MAKTGRWCGRIPRIGAQTGLPTPRSIYTRRAASFRAGPEGDETELFMLEKPLSVVVLRECGFYRLARADGLAASQCADDAPARTGAPRHTLDADDPALVAARCGIRAGAPEIRGRARLRQASPNTRGSQ